MTALPLIDTHTHAWPTGLRHPAQKSTGPLMASLSDLVGVLEAADVGNAVILPASLHSDNEWLVSQISASGGVFICVAAIDPWSALALVDLKRAALSGCRGVRFMPAAIKAHYARQPAFLDAAVDAAADLGLLVQWTVSLDHFDPVLRARARRPDLTMVIDHLGLPTLARADVGRAQELASHPGTYVKLSGLYAFSAETYPYRDAWDWAEVVIAEFGAERTMWGSDWPLATESASYAAQLALVDLLPFLDETSASHVRYSTAARVWGENGP